MPVHEYKVVPAPTRGRKAPGVKTPEARFALGLQDVLNEMGRDGWEYLRTDILPSEERQGLTSSHTVYRSMLVFRRADFTGENPNQMAETMRATNTDQHDPADATPQSDQT